VAGESKRTTDHETIRRWAEERDGVPATVQATGSEEEPGILRFDFPGYSGDETLEQISWDAFFEAFEANELAVLYQEETGEGETSRFFKFVSREEGE
jgi:hypothetical protein